MDGPRFDSLTHCLDHPGTRRGALGLLAGSLGALGLAGTQAKKKRRRQRRKNKKKSRSITRSFRNDTSIAIPSAVNTGGEGKADPYPQTINVSGFKKGKIQDVNVTLRGLSHTFPEDIDILLVAPDGKNAIIFSEVGGNTPVTDVTITLDDQATSALTPGPLVSGTFRPTNLAENDGADDFPDAPPPSGNVTLSTLNGSNPNGAWQLFVFDNAGAGTGSFAGGFQLTIKAKVRKKQRKKKRK